MTADMNEKSTYYGQFRPQGPVVKDVYQTVYKDKREGKLWTWTKNGSHENPTNRRYLTTPDELRHVVKRT